MAAPTATPTMPDSATGVSTTGPRRTKLPCSLLRRRRTRRPCRRVRWQDPLTIAAVFPHAGDPIALASRGMLDESQVVLPMYVLDGMNPFHREGVNLKALDVEVLKDETQETAAAIIDQVAQGSLLRVVMPWMIGRAFEKIGEPQFIDLISREKLNVRILGFELTEILRTFTPRKKALSAGMQNSLQNLFPRYNLTAKTWAALTKERQKYTDQEGMARKLPRRRHRLPQARRQPISIARAILSGDVCVLFGAHRRLAVRR